MKAIIPIVAISVQNLAGLDPAKIPDLLSDESLLDNLTHDLKHTAGDVAYLLILKDQVQKINYPAYAKRYEMVFPPEKEIETEGNIKYRKIAEYDYNSFEVQFDKDNIPSNIVVETAAN